MVKKFLVTPTVNGETVATQPWVQGQLGGAVTRDVATVTTSALASGASQQTTIELATSYRLLSVQTSAATRVRVYASLAAQAADLNRAVGVDPADDAGLLLEYITTDTNEHLLSPLVDGASMDPTPTSAIAITVTNNAGSTQAITVTLSWAGAGGPEGPQGDPGPAGPQGGTVAFGPQQTYTFVEADRAHPDSYWGDAGVMFMSWTPTVSGDLLLLGPSDNGDPHSSSFGYTLYRGSTANVDYPDKTAASANVNGQRIADTWVGDQVLASVEAGQAYTLAIVDWEPDFVGHTTRLDGPLLSLYSFGGIADPPPPPPAAAAIEVTQLPSGALAARPIPPYVGAGESSHIEGAGAEAPGYAAHAEGWLTSAVGEAAHAQGMETSATGDYSHAEGRDARAWRRAEHAHSSGTLGADRPIQVSRLVLGKRGTLGTRLQPGANHTATTPSIDVTDNRLSIIRIEIGAWDQSSDVVSAWRGSMTASKKNGTPRFVGAPSIVRGDYDAGAASWTVSANLSAGGINIDVDNGETWVDWVALVEIVEV